MRDWVVAPRADDDHVLGEGRAARRDRRRGSKALRDAGTQDRALSDAARPVQDRQAVGLKVGGDDFLRGVPSEEEGGILEMRLSRLDTGVEDGIDDVDVPLPPELTIYSTRAALFP
jgi:hypothetical protein